MTNNLKLILSTFTRQEHQNDCGRACLTSIFKYAGIKRTGNNMENSGELSLLELHKIAAQSGLDSRCVRMDLQALKEGKAPCILHVLNDAGQPHFIVHYPVAFGPGLHLIGDPDRKIELVPEEVLLRKWKSGAALYFEDIEPRNDLSHWWFPWNSFQQFKFIPKIWWIAVPFLNVVAAMLGLAVSLVVQKAVQPGFLESRQGFFVMLFFLLVMISSAKCALNYLRQWMMITLGSKMDAGLGSKFLNKLYRSFGLSGNYNYRLCLRTIAEIQKIHQATAVLIGVVFSDGLLIMVMFGCLYFCQPAFTLLEFGAFLAMFLVIDQYLPLLLIHFDSGYSPGNSIPIPGKTELRSSGALEYASFAEEYFQLNELFARKTRTLSGIANRINLLFDGIGTLNIILVLLFSISKLQAGLISYEQFLMTLILCYGMTLLMAKICNQLFVIAQGADTLKQNSLNGEKVRSES